MLPNGKRFRRAEQLPAQGMSELYDFSAPALRGKRSWTRDFSRPVEPSAASACWAAITFYLGYAQPKHWVLHKSQCFFLNRY
jgi:hypothetical protein